MENTGSGDNSTGEGGSGAEFPSSRGETFHIYVLSFAYGILVVSLVWVSGKPEISFVFFFLVRAKSIWEYMEKTEWHSFKWRCQRTCFLSGFSAGYMYM